MAVDFTKPIATADRAQNLTDTRDTLVALAKLLGDVTPTGAAAGMIRWSPANNKFQKYSGSTWGDLATTFSMNVSHLGGAPADDYAKKTDLSSAIPAGVIVMWSGSAASIPSGWRLCDGTNGTPDLRGRFIIGASASGGYAPGATGGATSAATDYAGSHYHPSIAITVGGTAISEAQMPSHRHAMYINSNRVVKWLSPAGGSGGYEPQYESNLGGNATGGWGEYAGGSQPHSHTASGYTDYQGSHTHTVATVPPYYALCFIQKA